LSHGERRRLELAMVLALKPAVFLLDEPMAGLGPEGTGEIGSLLQGLRKEAPMLLVEHDMDAVFALADRISVLVYGKVIASGAPDEIKSNSAVQEAYLGDDI
jgi:branched-chain amino acid transport system ATP-binding protein